MTWRTFVTALLITCAFIASLWMLVEPIYLEIDDAAIRLIIEGTDLSGEPPASHLVFTHEALARAAVALRRAFPGLQVWDLVLSVALATGIGCLGAIAWHAHGWSLAARGAAVVTVLAVVWPFVNGLQFTISAVICAGAAVVLAIYELFSRPAPRRWPLMAAGVLLLAGYSIRPMAAEGGALVILACFVPVALACDPRRTRLLRLCAVGALLLAAFAALDYMDRALYTARDGWARYYDQTWQFVTLIDWNSAARDGQMDAIRAAAGWSPNDWQMLWLGWGPTDQTLFGAEPVARAFAVLRGATSPFERLQTIVTGLTLPALMGVLRELTIVIALSMGLVLSTGNRRAVLLASVVLMEFVLICLVVQAGFKELPFRLLAPLQACLAGVIVVGASEHRRVGHRGTATVATAALVAICVQQGWVATRQARAELNHARAIERQTAELLQLNPSLVILHGDAFPAGHWWRPFHRPPAHLPMIRLGGNNGNPLLQHFLQRTGRPRLLLSICSDPSILVVADRSRLDLVTNYMAEHAARTVTWEPAFEGSFSAWRCH